MNRAMHNDVAWKALGLWHLAAFGLSFLIALAALSNGSASGAQVPPDPPAPPSDMESFLASQNVHDPHIAKDGEYYYVFSTGAGIPVRRSKDLVHWKSIGRVFNENVPDWAVREVPGASGIWAPDVAWFNGLYYLYYSVSTFGRNLSVIGLAVNKTLDPDRPDYHWVDQGKVVGSGPGNDYNAIDAGIAIAGPNRLALSFGSFWSGIKLVELDRETGKPLPGAEVRAIAGRPSPGAVEAPCILKHGRYFYLFVSFDLCCRGVESTYNIRVGRAASLEGPYVDQSGVPMLEGGGTLLLASDGRYVGTGHCSVLAEPKNCWLVYHAYDRGANGTPTLRVRPMRFNRDGWPILDQPLGD